MTGERKVTKDTETGALVKHKVTHDKGVLVGFNEHGRGMVLFWNAREPRPVNLLLLVEVESEAPR